MIVAIDKLWIFLFVYLTFLCFHFLQSPRSCPHVGMDREHVKLVPPTPGITRWEVYETGAVYILPSLRSTFSEAPQPQSQGKGHFILCYVLASQSTHEKKVWLDMDIAITLCKMTFRMN